MAATAYDIIREASTHWLLGEYAAADGTLQGGGSTVVFSDANLITYTADTRYRGYHAFIHSGGEERRVYSTNLAAGELQVMRPLTAAPGTSAYLLTRDFGWSDKSGSVNWLRFLNETCRSIFIDDQITLRGQTDLFRFTLPTPISQGNWIQQFLIGDFPVMGWSERYPDRVAWYRVDKRNVINDLYLVLEESIDAEKEILFIIRRPLSHAHQSAYTFSRSVLVPFGSTSEVDIPRQALVLGTVWHAMVAKRQNLTGNARDLWTENLKRCAQLYAAAIAPLGPVQVGTELGYATSW